MALQYILHVANEDYTSSITSKYLCYCYSYMYCNYCKMVWSGVKIYHGNGHIGLSTLVRSRCPTYEHRYLTMQCGLEGFTLYLQLWSVKLWNELHFAKFRLTVISQETGQLLPCLSTDPPKTPWEKRIFNNNHHNCSHRHLIFFFLKFCIQPAFKQ